ncbi:recombination regulator RecX [Streptomyces canus]|uniref:recombination regulator RecX n=1 Tax=Streptomyces canus TaxID=58343 RepID=UPI00225BC7B3|nr:recombination regulator RecX [Streptomyces canus]MCX4856433.1 recombination regulator RecX [Streptomyces canus]WSW38105.1 recombination regulator RecX [Streptomyces canus]
MTRRTDWAEYEDAPRGRGGKDDGGSAGPGGGRDGADGGHGREMSYGVEGAGGDDLAYGAGDGAARGSGAFGRGSRRGGQASGGSRGRRQRRRGFGESPGEDGGGPSLSRAEKGEPPADPVERARAICLRLLTGTPRTRKQLADALRKREIPDDAAEEVLSRFEEVGLINDSAFADAWVESRHHGRGLARRALAQELRTKGVDPTLVDAAVSQLDSEQEEATARELVDRKLRATRGLDRDKRLRRLAGMLARKGYSEGMALRVVRQALEEEGEETEFLGDEGF